MATTLVQSDRVKGNIYETKNYDKFKFMDGNRRVNEHTYLKLLDSMSDEQLVIPILVNKNFEIIDGQHRYKACKELKKPVYYHIQEEYGIDQVKKANMIGSNWVKEDFLNMFLAQENETYEYIDSLRSTYGVNLSVLIKLFASFQYQAKAVVARSFEEGTFSLDKSSDVEDFLKCLLDFKEIGFKYYNTDLFIQSFLVLYTYESYDHSVLKRKLKAKKALFERKRTRDDYLLFLCDIYNIKLTEKNKLFYDPNRKVFYKSEV